MLLIIYSFMKVCGACHLQWLYNTSCAYLSMGHHVYKAIWSPVIGETMRCEREIDKPHDPNAIRLINNGHTAGHILKDLTKMLSYCLPSCASINAIVNGQRNGERV